MVCIIYGGQLANLCLLSKDLLNFEPPYRKCWIRPWEPAKKARPVKAVDVHMFVLKRCLIPVAVYTI